VIGFRDYIKYAEKHLRIAEREIENRKSGDPYLIPCVMLAWTAIESFVNNRLEELDTLPSDLFAPHEKAFLTEKRLQFQNSGQYAGQFLIKGDDYKNLSDKILFLMAKHGGTGKKGTTLWQQYDDLRKLRDSLVHPRKTKHRAITPALARQCVRVSQKVIILISEELGQRVEF
jgi:hypothetical protein